MVIIFIRIAAKRDNSCLAAFSRKPVDKAKKQFYTIGNDLPTKNTGKCERRMTMVEYEVYSG